MHLKVKADFQMDFYANETVVSAQHFRDLNTCFLFTKEPEKRICFAKKFVLHLVLIISFQERKNYPQLSNIELCLCRIRNDPIHHYLSPP